MAALDAGYSNKASGVTLDRFCGGGISAVNMAAASIMSGMEDLIVAGGVEMMSYTSAEGTPNPLDAGNLDLRNAHPQTNVGIAADIIATEEGFSRIELDAFSAESQRRAAEALKSGAFSKSLIPVYRPGGDIQGGRIKVRCIVLCDGECPYQGFVFLAGQRLALVFRQDV